MERKGRQRGDSVGGVVDGNEFDEDVFDEFEWNLVRSVGKGVGGIRVDFHEDAIDAGGDGCAGKDRGEFAISAGGAAESAGALHRVGGVKDDGQAFLADPVKRAHVGDEVVIAEGGAALGDQEAIATEGAHFVPDVDGVPGGEELAFFDVHGAAGFSGGFEQVGLAAEEGRDLEEIDVFGGDVRLFGSMDVGGDGDSEFAGDFPEDPATFFDARAAE